MITLRTLSVQFAFGLTVVGGCFAQSIADCRQEIAQVAQARQDLLKKYELAVAQGVLRHDAVGNSFCYEIVSSASKKALADVEQMLARETEAAGAELADVTDLEAPEVFVSALGVVKTGIVEAFGERSLQPNFSSRVAFIKRAVASVTGISEPVNTEVYGSDVIGGREVSASELKGLVEGMRFELALATIGQSTAGRVALNELLYKLERDGAASLAGLVTASENILLVSLGNWTNLYCNGEEVVSGLSPLVLQHINRFAKFLPNDVQAQLKKLFSPDLASAGDVADDAWFARLEQALRTVRSGKVTAAPADASLAQ